MEDSHVFWQFQRAIYCIYQCQNFCRSYGEELVRHTDVRAETVPQAAKVFVALKQCPGCDSCATHGPKEQCPFPASSPCLVPPGFATPFLALFLLLKIPTALTWPFWMSGLRGLFAKGGHSPSHSIAAED